MAAECAVIAKMLDIPDIGENNKNMIVVKPKSSNSIANAIVDLVKNKELRKYYSKRSIYN